MEEGAEDAEAVAMSSGGSSIAGVFIYRVYVYIYVHMYTYMYVYVYTYMKRARRMLRLLP